MGLHGLHILTTRDALGPDHLQQMLVALGAEVQVIPTIELLPPSSWEAFDRMAHELDQVDWLLFTSINGVIQTHRRLEELSISLPNHIQIAVVGKKTASEVQRAGWAVSLVPRDFQAEGLIQAFSQMDLKGKNIFFPRAEVAREVLPQTLQKLGAQVTVTSVYRNLPAFSNRERLATALEHQSVDWITFTSASTVQNFKQILGELPAKLPKLASIGKVTSEAMLALGLSPAVTANPQTLDGLVAAIKQYETDNPKL